MNRKPERPGPLAVLAGARQGDEGDATTPDDDRTSAERNLYRDSNAFKRVQ